MRAGRHCRLRCAASTRHRHRALYRRGTVTEAMLFAFDLIEFDGVDYRPLPLRERKERLARLVDRRLAPPKSL
jgi:ATP-dependent DNA ligase